jgi:hypothetical protein
MGRRGPGEFGVVMSAGVCLCWRTTGIIVDIKVICIWRAGAMAFPIRGLAADVIDKLDAAASERGLSRNAYIVEVLTQHARQVRPVVTRESFAQAATLAADLGNEELMTAAWS